MSAAPSTAVTTTTRLWRPALKALALAVAVVLMLPLLLLLYTLVFGANWARGPLQNLVLQRTGRALLISGDLDLLPAWPLPRVRAQGLHFANPDWATAPQMLRADTVDIAIDAPQLLRGRLAFAELRLLKPELFLEQASGGRKTWLLDLKQTDEDARIPIGRVELAGGQITYIDHDHHTALHAELATRAEPAPTAPTAPTAPAGTAKVADPGHALAFSVYGQWRGQTLAAQGHGGAVMGWRDETTPYPLTLQATLDRTKVQAQGTVTGLLALTAVDLQLALAGDSLASLYPALGIALPPSPAYEFKGHLLRSGAQWRYEAFSGRIGHSDLAGSLQLQTGGTRPLLTGSLASKHLDPADLGPAVGVPDKPSPRVLPDLPFDTARWASLDADLQLQAQSFLRAGALPLDRLRLHLRLQDRVLTLDPLEFGLAGGRLRAGIVLDGRKAPLQGRAQLALRGAQLARLMPATDTPQMRIGRVDGDAVLAGHGASVGAMLANASGHLRLGAQGGEISRLLMEQTGLHLLEILRLNLTGDQTVPLRCALADFAVVQGRMQVRTLVLDTSINTVVGSGSLSLADETLDLTLVPHTKVASLVALRSPIYVRGRFREPAVTLDTGRIAARGLGAVLLGLVNPLLAVVPLFDPGPGVDVACSGPR